MALVSACTETRSGFDLSVVVDAALGVEQLIATVTRGGTEAIDPVVAAPGEALLVIVPKGWVGQAVEIDVKGIAGGKVVARGGVASEVRAESLRQLVIYLKAGSCLTPCKEGEHVCADGGVRRCKQDSEGCWGWSSVSTCPTATPYCREGSCSAACADACVPGEQRCSPEGGLQVCGNAAEGGCREWGTVRACPGDESCSDGACIPLCDGKPCSCKSGETRSCADVGVCRGGQRRCVDGRFGACEWEQGPSPEACDGEDNDCNGVVDDGLVAPLCPLQKGVCQGARQRCEGKGGWKPCGKSDYSSAAAAHGATYEEQESLCDEKDNDCNADTDEPKACKGAPCGDGRCDPDETARSCPADCPAAKCGNGTCDYLENTDSCPADCAADGCKDKPNVCVGTESLQYCKDGTWRQSSCTLVCDMELRAAPDTCKLSPENGTEVCFCGKSLLGVGCTEHAQCPNGTVCTLTSTGSKGFCTRSCSSEGASCGVVWPESALPNEGTCTLYEGKLGCSVQCNIGLYCPEQLSCSNIFGEGLCQP